MAFYLHLSRKVVASTAIIVLALLMVSCALGPRMDVDTTNLGSRPLGLLIAKTWMLPEERISDEVASLVQARKPACANSKDCLEDLGFQHCQHHGSTTVCSYTGDIKAVLQKPRGQKVENNVRVQIEMDVHEDQIKLIVKKFGSI